MVDPASDRGHAAGGGRSASSPPGPSSSASKAVDRRTQLLLRAGRHLHREVSRRQRAELRAALESAVTRVMTSSPNFTDALPHLAKALCLGGSWDAVEHWTMDNATGGVVWAGLFARAGQDLRGLQTVSEHLKLGSGDGIPGQVLRDGKPLWSRAVAKETPGPRGSALKKAGMSTSLSLAFRGGEGTVGVLTLYRREDQPENPEEVDYLGRILQQVARLGSWKWGAQAQSEVEDRFKDFVESYPLPVFVCDVTGRIRFVSDSMQKLLGRELLTARSSVHDLPKGLPLYVAGTSEVYPVLKLPFVRALAGEASYADDLEVRRDGRSSFMEAWSSPLRGRSGEVEYAIGVVINTTALRRQREELEKAREAALAADRAKSDFVSRMSHEIRTPLNAILGSVDLLWETPLTQDQQEYVRLCRDAGQGLMSLISNVLDLSRVEAGKLELAETPFGLEEFVERTVELFSLRAHQKGLELTSYVEPGVPERIVGDPVRLRQILVNLMGNALKFTDKGHISIRVRHDPGSQDPGYLFFSVQDTGIGIPADRKEAIFDRFVQAKASTAAEYGGSGLGLTITRHLVELMGGRIWVESAEGEGSTFNFLIHVKVAQGSPIRSARPELKGLRVMIVDGSAVDRQSIHGLLEELASSVSLAESSKEATDQIALARGEGNPFQLILLGDRLSDGGTLSLAKELSKDGQAAHVVFLPSPGKAKESAPELRALGIVNVVSKPLDRQTFLASLANAARAAKVLPKPPRRISRGPNVATPNLEGLRLLVAEDSEDNRFLLQRFLRNTACRIEVAENGKVALDKFQRGEYDLVLMDLQMPFMDGYAATREIRAFERRRGLNPTPIIALSAYAIKEEIEKSLAAGCDAHVTKPIDKAKLFEILGNFGKKAEA
ncbi:MAG: response regulator [Euryarchaeota archaeon]|nr:response regulator [Euryarchaeota archaeon]